ncbi:hypothetical protein [Methanimicrococcus hacksteinii]|nr:hypothetical protein [Methanimicrococcus sp. At1]
MEMLPVLPVLHTADMGRRQQCMHYCIAFQSAGNKKGDRRRILKTVVSF